MNSHFSNDIADRLSRHNNIKVLAIDDQAMVAEGLRRMLEPEKDLEFLYCDNPTRAIEMAIDEEVSLILLDLVMPDIDGMTLVRYFRANHYTKDIPIIVMSSKEDPQIKHDAFTHGANDYVVKLPDKIELVARIRAHARQYQLQQERDVAITALREMQRQLEQTNRELQRLSSLDPLTAIWNRRVFDDKLMHEWNRARREQEPIGLMLIDIDYFKFYNDYYGHQAGDNTLRQVAETLKHVVNRPGDVVARYGGEEFGVILPITDDAGMQVVAEKFQRAVAELKIPHARSRVAEVITISLGAVTIIPEENIKPEELIKQADQALYEAKQKGRNRAVYTSSD